MFRQKIGYLNSVYQGLVGPLTLKWAHWMKSVSQQYYSVILEYGINWVSIICWNGHHVLLFGGSNHLWDWRVPPLQSFCEELLQLRYIFSVLMSVLSIDFEG